MLSLPAGIGRSTPTDSIYGIFVHLDQVFCRHQDVPHRILCVSRTRWGWYRLSGSNRTCWVRPQECLWSGCSRWDYPHIVWPKLWGRMRTCKWSSHCSEDETPMSQCARVKRAKDHVVRERSPTFWNYFRIIVFGTTFSLYLWYQCWRDLWWYKVHLVRHKRSSTPKYFEIISFLIWFSVMFSFKFSSIFFKQTVAQASVIQNLVWELVAHMSYYYIHQTFR